MKTPTQEQFQVVIDTLEKANSMAKGIAEVNMLNGFVEKEKNLCGTPLCHGGWYVVASELDTYDYMEGANKMANDLGFDDYSALEDWASDNSAIWGNIHGNQMFNSSSAFLDKGYVSDLSEIIDHWKGVKERAISN